jgi:hypothetical protein
MRLYSGAFPAEDGRIRATFELVFLTGWAPAEASRSRCAPARPRRGWPMRWARSRPAGDAVRPPRD